MYHSAAARLWYIVGTEGGNMGKLERDFFDRDTLTVARELLGKYVVRSLGGTLLAGRITETEAYIGRMDKACHAYGYKRTPRTETLFAPPGTAYIYLIYGMYCCLNFVTEPEGEPCAVLLRAVELRAGGDEMARLRFGCSMAEMSAYQRKNFLNGPGKVCKALSLTKAQNGLDLTGDELFLTDDLSSLGLPLCPGDEAPLDIKTGKRVGIDYAEEAVHFPWRFTL